MWETFLNILAVVGVVIVGAIIIYLIAYLAMNGLNKNNRNSSPEAGLVRKSKKDKVIRPTVLDTNELDDEFEDKKESEKAETQEKPKAWNDNLADQEKQTLVSNDKMTNNLFFDSKPMEPKKTEKDFDDFDNIFNNEINSEPVDVSEKALNDMINKINIESIAEYNAENKEQNYNKENISIAKPQTVQAIPVVEQESETESEQKDLLNGQANLFDEENNEPAESAKIKLTPDEDEDDEEDFDYEQEKLELEQERKELDQEQANIEAEREDLEGQKKQLEEEKQRLEELKAEQANTVAVNNITSIYSSETLEQLTARLELLNERLKSNKKDLRENKREFGPLSRVKKTFEKDKAKLNRREAIVARQKVILYGVNNYVDIDEEKAKKLNEDLDLLDGLRLSVQHCEDVINANKDRFPILEKTNKIVRKVNAEILADIAEVEKAIADKQAKGEE